MQVDFFSGNVSHSSSLFTHVAQRASDKLARFTKRIGRIVVRVVDVNGSRKGIDKLCQIEASIPGGQMVFAHAIDRDAYIAADRAMTSFRANLIKKLERIKRR